MSTGIASAEFWSRAQIEEVSRAALTSCGAAPAVAGIMARAIGAAECDGIPSHGLAYLPTYCQHLACGKVNPSASVTTRTEGAVVRVDADAGFAHPAVAEAFAMLVPLASRHGVACAAIYNSYNCGVLGYHTEALALEGLVGLGFTNAPASIAPWGGRKAMFGTNPYSVAAPDGRGGVAFIIDQSASVVAKSEVMRHEREGNPVPVGWVLDPEGRPTTDPALGLKGTMVPAGGAKGVGAALFVELMAACLTGATLGCFAAPFSGAAGGPPRTGQFFIAIDPAATSGGNYVARTGGIVSAMAEMEGARLPGSRRLVHRARANHEGVRIPRSTVERITSIEARG